MESSKKDEEIEIKTAGFVLKYGASIPVHVFEKIQKAVWEGLAHFIITKTDYLKIIDSHKKAVDLSEKLSKTAENNNKGIALERSGDLNSAIGMYEENIKIGYPATHSYDRLLVIYRKLNLFEDEIRIIDLYIQMIKERDLKRSNNLVSRSFGMSESSEILKLQKRKLSVTNMIEKRG